MRKCERHKLADSKVNVGGGQEVFQVLSRISLQLRGGPWRRLSPAAHRVTHGVDTEKNNAGIRHAEALLFSNGIIIYLRPAKMKSQAFRMHSK